jgi:type IV secretion system protein VirB10
MPAATTRRPAPGRERHHDAGPSRPRDREPSLGADAAADGNTISPLPGEPGIPNVATRQRISMSKKGLLAVLLLIGSLVAVAAFTIQRFSASGKKADEEESKLVKDKPTAATSEPRKLEMPPAPTASAAVATAPRIPALDAHGRRVAEPIGVRRTGSGAPASGGPKVVPPEDAPVLLVTTRPGALPPPGASTRRADAVAPSAEGMPASETADPNDPIAATSRNLQGYQRQLQGMLESLTKTAALATGQATGHHAIGGTPRRAPDGRHPNRGAPAAGAACSGASSKVRPPPRWRPRCWATAA